MPELTEEQRAAKAAEAAAKAQNKTAAAETKKYRVKRQLAKGKVNKQGQPIVHPIGSIVELTDDEALGLVADQTVERAVEEVEL